MRLEGMPERSYLFSGPAMTITAARQSHTPGLVYGLVRRPMMPSRNAMRKAQTDRRRGKAPGTQAGEFVREEIEHVREGKHGARSPKQAIAIGLSKARRAGVELSPPKKGKTSEDTRRKAVRDIEKGHGAAPRQTVTAKRKSASKQALRREGRQAASRAALSSQARSAARRRSPGERSAAARKAARTREMHAHA